MNAAFCEMSCETATKRTWSDEDESYWASRGAWAVVIDGIAPDPSHTGWAGHVVGAAQGVLVDGAASQMSRPEKNLVLPEVLVTGASKQFLRGLVPSSAGNSDGCVVRYEVRPGDYGFREIPGFGSDHKMNLEMADAIEQAVRERLSMPPT